MDLEIDYGGDYHYIPATSVGNGIGIQVMPDIFSYTVQIVNIVFTGTPQSENFVLIDAGMPGSAIQILSALKERFGEEARPKAIILTHGHFDHVGALVDLVQHWEIPVYAHELELPFLTGQRNYPEPDPTVEGGMIAKISALFPNEAINLGNYVEPLPSNGSVPHLPNFQWMHTPGHSPGHISLFREQDKTLIAGDAFVTVKQDSLYKVFTQEQEVNGPPIYFTPDWKTAKQSVIKLASLKPQVAITGHGLPMSGDALASGLERLAQQFDDIAVPDHGRYVDKQH
ncbi:MBL fold metallo-hydrolase [Heyndrickxia ginsengihumi]|uniref:MBL fold metallo-hydrolase n=1 Tax=Heyndrickxia ginsengihumi TaxID=363870 RepID=A0A0A6Y2Z9_9BACI|nr:MBL fold metallo-hydrolase [Heyndrickxia ginsengihumi]KHD86652.1 metallo-beta-lactamase family protein [Heyndrickxia ginsengihumi]MBE6184796.1 MBL fold metallo-hydrolase [Bacillus sp. (in: firmicutes)]MCM3022694.1 MBL fold metallo-hydrolase [Heyndrickxia ginsengihumi]NEY18968.1 MBL fold metallo-hydrolase [Heyndrickxia ginsengihumi]